MGLFADPESEKTGGSNANLVAGIALLVVGLGFIAWACLRPIVGARARRAGPRRPDPAGATKKRRPSH